MAKAHLTEAGEHGVQYVLDLSSSVIPTELEAGGVQGPGQEFGDHCLLEVVRQVSGQV